MTASIEIQIPPWATPGLWREINDAMAMAVKRRGRRLQAAIRLARQFERWLASLDGIMETLCADSCPACRDVCCQRAMIWYDFKDLLCLHIGGAAVPDAQIVRASGQPCPNQGAVGCALPRTQRPFVCTWYLCPPQKKALRLAGSTMAVDMAQTLAKLKQTRTEIETLFVQAVAA